MIQNIEESEKVKIVSAPRGVSPVKWPDLSDHPGLHGELLHQRRGARGLWPQGGGWSQVGLGVGADNLLSKVLSTQTLIEIWRGEILWWWEFLWLVITCQCAGAAARVEILDVVLIVVEFCAALFSLSTAAWHVD